MGLEVKGTLTIKLIVVALMLAGAPFVAAQLQPQHNPSPCLLDNFGNAGLSEDCVDSSTGSNQPSRYSTSTTDLYLTWATGAVPPSNCFPNSIHYEYELGNLYVCGQWWNDAHVDVIYYTWRTTPTPPSTTIPLTIGAWTGIWESELKYLHIVYAYVPDLWGGDPSSASGLPD